MFYLGNEVRGRRTVTDRHVIDRLIDPYSGLRSLGGGELELLGIMGEGGGEGHFRWDGCVPQEVLKPDTI